MPYLKSVLRISQDLVTPFLKGLNIYESMTMQWPLHLRKNRSSKVGQRLFNGDDNKKGINY